MTGSIRVCLAALLLVLGTVITPAAGSTITYNWVGVVNDVAPWWDSGVKIGEKIPVDLTLNGALSPVVSSPGVGEYFAFLSSEQQVILAVNIGGRTEIGYYELATVLNDHNGTDGVSVESAWPMSGRVFSIVFSTSKLNVLTSEALPLSLDPHDFDVADFTVYHDDTPIFSGRLLATPLPGGIGMFISALTGLVGMSLWKSRHLKVETGLLG
jgi:hypothetical protein